MFYLKSNSHFVIVDLDKNTSRSGISDEVPTKIAECWDKIAYLPDSNLFVFRQRIPHRLLYCREKDLEVPIAPYNSIPKV